MHRAPRSAVTLTMLDAIPSYRRYLSAAALTSSLTILSACSSDKPYQPDLFSNASASPYAHAFNASHGDACEAARRAMLSQGYTTTISTADTVDANKGFQPTAEQHIAVSFHIVCIPGEASTSTSMLYVNAIQDNYGLKKSDTSASVGLSILGSVSLPIRSNSDSMVKLSSQTIPPGPVYDRFFALVDHYLKTVVRTTPIGDNDDPMQQTLPPLPALIVPVASAAAVPVISNAVPDNADKVQLLKPLPPPTPPAAAPLPDTASGTPANAAMASSATTASPAVAASTAAPLASASTPVAGKPVAAPASAPAAASSALSASAAAAIVQSPSVAVAASAATTAASGAKAANP